MQPANWAQFGIQRLRVKAPTRLFLSRPRVSLSIYLSPCLPAERQSLLACLPHQSPLRPFDSLLTAPTFPPAQRDLSARVERTRQLELLEGVFVPVPQGGTERARAGWFARLG
eukprot:scaffold118126_cov48-Phaeocystis_antarctica.AAC.2